MGLLKKYFFPLRFRILNRYNATRRIWSGVCAIFRNATCRSCSGLKKWLIAALGAGCSGVAVCSGESQVARETIKEVLSKVPFDHPRSRADVLGANAKPSEQASKLVSRDWLASSILPPRPFFELGKRIAETLGGISVTAGCLEDPSNVLEEFHSLRLRARLAVRYCHSRRACVFWPLSPDGLSNCEQRAPVIGGSIMESIGHRGFNARQLPSVVETPPGQRTSQGMETGLDLLALPTLPAERSYRVLWSLALHRNHDGPV